MNRRIQTVVFGAIPTMALLAVANLTTIPGTDILLTVPYAAEGPGPMFNTLSTIDGVEVVEVSGADEDETAGQLNMTTVSVRTNMTFMQAAARWLLTDDDLVPIEHVIPQDKTEEEVNEANQQAFLSSESSATTAALRYLNMPLSVEVAEIVEDSPADGTMAVGDRIVSIDGEAVTSGGHAQQLVRAKKPGDEVRVEFSHDGTTQERTVTLAEHPRDARVPLLGISMVTAPDNGIEVTYHLEDVGGPSAGMIFALTVVDKLSPGELNHGKVVAGTGTIDDDGVVGHIGGIEHKARAAADAGVELFLSPRENCADLAGKDYGSMTIAAVDTLDDAVAQMDAFAAGGEVNQCG